MTYRHDYGKRSVMEARDRHSSYIVGEGVPFILLMLAGTMVSFYLTATILFVLFSCGTIFVAWFFRNPQREVPDNAGWLVSPADGRVLKIEEVTHEEYGRFIKISIFMNVFNVHVNRIPYGGRIAAIRYHKGSFLSANLDKASTDNERNTLVIDIGAGRRILVVQIAGLIARRIVCWLQEGMNVEKGERFGMIRFGSRVELFMPPDTKILVRQGEKVLAGKTPIGELT